MSINHHEIDADEMRYAMRRWASGVTVVTSFHQGIQQGMTVSSFTSVALSPPLILISLEWGSRTHQLVEQSRIFGVTILEASQSELSDRFAGRISDLADRFVGLDTFTLTSGAPFLFGGLAYFDCSVMTAVQAGNHTIYIGQVGALKIGEKSMPLVYYDRTYRQFREEQDGRTTDS